MKLTGQQNQPDEAVIATLKQGMAFHKENAVEEAVRCYQAVLEAMPSQPDALYYLGMIELAQGKAADAVDKLTRTFATSPCAEVGYNLSKILTKLNRPQEAIEALGKVLALEPHHINAAFDYGLLLRDAGRYDEAIFAFKQTLSSTVHKWAAVSNIGLCYQDIGQLAEARECYEKLTTLKPEYGLGWRQLATVTKFADTSDARISAMKSAYAAAKTSADKMNLAFALGKAHDDMKLYDEAIAYYIEGNRIKRTEYPDFSIEKTRIAFARLLEFFTPDYYQKAPFATVEGSERMVFIVGMPRSSTSLVEQILASHPEVYGAGELDLFYHLAQKLAGKNLAQLSVDDLNALADSYLKVIAERAPSDARMVIDKGLLNSRYVGIMAQVFPHAKFIYCKRNPLDNCISIFRQSFVGAYPFAYDLEEIGHYYKLQGALMERYKHILPADRFYEIDYERFVGDFEAETRKLLEFCGLSWHADCLEYYNTSRPVKTASAAQVREPLYRSSISTADRYGAAIEPLKKILAY